jgi:plasmid stabilization system protein ParE
LLVDIVLSGGTRFSQAAGRDPDVAATYAAIREAREQALRLQQRLPGAADSWSLRRGRLNRELGTGRARPSIPAGHPAHAFASTAEFRPPLVRPRRLMPGRPPSPCRE